MSDTAEVAVIGGGPAGLMAAEMLANAGVQVDLYDAMATVGRKFLIAGKGGLNLTHSESFDRFLGRYGLAAEPLRAALEHFGPDALRLWARELNVETVVGSSGRVFPADMKAAPLLRSWLRRLRASGVRFHLRHRWCGWAPHGALRFETPHGGIEVEAKAVVLALGGGSWARLGSSGAWASLLGDRGIDVRTIKPSNCGFDTGWSAHLRERHAGQPVKPVVITVSDARGDRQCLQGEFVVTETGVEGGAIYALSPILRDAIEQNGSVMLHLDLAPGRELERLVEALSRPHGSHSVSKHIRRQTGIDGIKATLLREVLSPEMFKDPVRIAAAIKSLPLRLVAARPIDEAISTAGGVAFDEIDGNLMLCKQPGVFCAGEMLDWEAPTGGYLLTACMATGRIAGNGAAAWLNKRKKE